MFKITNFFIICLAAILGLSAACSKNENLKPDNSTVGTAGNSNTAAAVSPVIRATPSTAFTASDIGKLKWIEGTWRGMDGEKPFFERYRFDGTTMLVDSFTDESLTKVEDTSRFELQNGEFGHTEGDKRAAASSISDNAVQFVPVAGGGNAFRFERQSDGTWQAVLEWIDKEKKPQQKIYKMEKWPKDK